MASRLSVRVRAVPLFLPPGLLLDSSFSFHPPPYPAPLPHHSNMFPLLLALLRNVPIVGELLKRPEPGGGGRRGEASYYQDDYDRGYGGGGRGRDRW